MKFEDTDTVFFGPMVGELGWACSRWHAWCRYRRFMEFPNHRSIAADYDWRYPLYADFTDEFIPLPKWFTDLGLEQDCYEAVPLDAPAGANTPNSVYFGLHDYFRTKYNPETTWVVRPPRGYNFIVQERAQQMWKPLVPSDNAKAFVKSVLGGDTIPLIILSARKRARANNRNIPEFVWNTVVDRISKDFNVVIIGTKNSSALVNKVGRNIINLIPNIGTDGLDLLIAFLQKAFMSVTSQSGPTLISLLCETPSYIVGHESTRHTKYENFLNTAVMFRQVPNNVYAALTPEMMIQDIYNFHSSVQHALGLSDQVYRESCTVARDKMHSLLVEPINLYHLDVKGMRQEIIYGKPE
jgi:hypothetical protein